MKNYALYIYNYLSMHLNVTNIIPIVYLLQKNIKNIKIYNGNILYTINIKINIVIYYILYTINIKIVILIHILI